MNIQRNKMFDEFLDEAYPTYEIASVELKASDILFNTDPIAYNEAKLSYFNATIGIWDN